MKHHQWLLTKAAPMQRTLVLLAVAASMSLLSLPGAPLLAHAHPLGASDGELMKPTGRGLLEDGPPLIGEARASVPTGCSLTVTTPAAPAYVNRLIAEPHKPTTFLISYTCLGGSPYVIKAEGPQGQVAFGGQVALTYTKLGLDKIKVYVCPQSDANPAGGADWCGHAPRLVGKVGVTVVYVRREIRSMSAADRQDYFDAIKIMGNTSTAAGRSRYGAGFYNYYEMVARHASIPYTKPCDLAHLGPAFTVAHRALVIEFERIVQLIKPHLAVPYWNYLADGDLPDPTQSELWTNDYYGSLFGDAADNYIVKDGQFAYWRVPAGEEAKQLAAKTWGKLGPARTVNPWGFLRGGENMNKQSFVTRIGPGPVVPGLPTSLPKTSDWQGCRDITDFGVWAKCVDINIHSGPHGWMAGKTGLPTFAEKQAEIDCSVLDQFGPGVCELAFNAFSYLGLFGRGGWRADGCLVCNKTCTLDQPIEECNCECSAETPRCSPANEVKRAFNKAFFGDVELGRSPIPPPLFDFGGDFGKYGICGNGIIGDYNDVATSTLDPVFWVHHAMIDRVLVSWRFLHPDLDYETFNFTSPSTDKTKFPDFLSSTNILNPGTPHAAVFGAGDGDTTGVCAGHGLYDKTCLGAFSGTFRTLPPNREMTNLDLLQTVDVQINSPELANYIYDTLQA